MSMDAIAAKMREKVEGSGFSKSVKFDCGADGVEGGEDRDQRAGIERLLMAHGDVVSHGEALRS